LQSEVVSHRTGSTSVAAALSKSEEQLQDVRAQLSEKESALSSKEAAVASLTKESSGKDAEIKRLTASTDKLNADKTRIESELQGMTKAKELCDAQLAGLTRDKENLMGEIQVVKKHIADQEAVYAAPDTASLAVRSRKPKLGAGGGYKLKTRRIFQKKKITNIK
jgi:chromosome segregation ATPase